MPRLLQVSLTAAALGVAVPVAILLIDYGNLVWGWWPDANLVRWSHWIHLVWPTSYMLIATSAIYNAFFFEVAAISIALNAVLYALLATLLVELHRRFRRTGAGDSTGLRSNNRWRGP